MTFNLIKMRDKTSRTYIAQPFNLGSTIRLMEDMGGVPQFKESIHTAPEIKRNSIIKMTGTTSMFNNINDVLDIDNDDIKNNAFAKQTYSLNPENDIRPKPIKPIEFTDNINNLFKDKLKEVNTQFDLNEIDNNINSKKEVICPIYFETKVG
jgi:hypothetical protein